MTDKDGWIEWGGGECPVDRQARVDVRFRGSMCGISSYLDEPANYWLWQHATARGDFADEDDDIIAYRIVSPPSENKDSEDERSI